ncbi:hypothetical protein SB49_15610 [Sediminicola sp. YIK13]|uniref:hypothetical protein n=1 Tax=Sediminicola sp. YIK13 TaxID=1453352 RepID=UPI00071F5DB9|nr:hypothetical protein [Sediminicola sp. YIK13]ALM09058.1 hypothetical protein SB49_15610 [Sediminicola sp. YIK13]
MRQKVNVKLILWLVIFTFLNPTLEAQNLISSQISERYRTFYKSLRENIHLHLNKTSFSKGEQLWFTAYVYDGNNQVPSSSSTNLHVGIFNEAGKLIERKMIYLQDGIGNGNFLIDSSYASSNYYIKSHTNWMNNFPALKPFIQEFRVLDRIELTNLEKEPDQNPSIAIYPEGGKLVRDVKNTIGFQVKPTSWNVMEIENLVLVDDLGSIILDNIVINSYGMGKVTFLMDGARTYSLSLKLKNEAIIAQTLPAVEQQGTVLNISTIHPQKIHGTLVANRPTIDQVNQKPFYLAVHKDGQIFIEELFLESESASFIFEKAKLPFGVNSITVFDHLYNPLVSRLFFNEYGADNAVMELSVAYELNASKDSLMVALNTANSYEGNMSLSISALPNESISYSPTNSVLSSFLLTPYTGSRVDKPRDYFKEWNRTNMFDLDILLLIKGWGTYNWDHIFEGKINEQNTFETGMNISGRILDADLDTEKQVWGYSDGLTSTFITDIERDKTFKSRLILFEGDSLKISVLDRKGKLRNPKAEIEFGSLSDLNLNEVDAYRINHRLNNLGSVGDLPFISGNEFLITEKTIVLDEVIVSEQKEAFKDIPINSAIVTGKRITDDDIKRRATITDYLRKLGYKIVIRGGKVTVLSKTAPPGAMALHVPIPVIIGGMLSDGNELLTMPLSSVQSVYYDFMGNQFISIVPRPGHYILEKKKNYISFLIKNGFARPQEYYDPGYNSFESDEFNNYGVLHWLPKVILNNNSPTTIKIPLLNQKSIQLHIEGMGSNGSLISTSKSIEITYD